jgi:ferrous iron transport protein A
LLAERGDRVVATAEFATVIDRDACTLADLQSEMTAIVAGVDAALIGESVARRLAEIGFLPGETVRVLARVPGGNPIAVRIGTSTFALRRHEAACVRVYGQQVFPG